MAEFAAEHRRWERPRNVAGHPPRSNLWLAVGGLRPDGMHEVDTCYQAIDLADRIEIARSPKGVEVTCTVRGDNSAGVPQGEANLAARAALLLAARTGHDLRISIAIEKRIPAGAGLGGASSDAAAVLLALGRRFAVPDPEHTLGDLAAELGATCRSSEGGTGAPAGSAMSSRPPNPRPSGGDLALAGGRRCTPVRPTTGSTRCRAVRAADRFPVRGGGAATTSSRSCPPGCRRPAVRSRSSPPGLPAACG